VNFTQYNPTQLVFGSGQISHIGNILRKSNIQSVLWLNGEGSIKKNGVYKQVIDSLQTAGIHSVEVWGIHPNPDLNKVRECIALAHEHHVEAILAVGGGSVIDSAKAVAAGYYLDDVWEAFTGKVPITQALPLFTVLTLSATGSEMNPNAVITNTDTKQKWSIASPVLFPRVSIVDPSIQVDLSWYQTVNGAIDATAHILEYYLLNEEQEITLSIDEALLRSIMKVTDQLQSAPHDLHAREHLCYAATLALNGLTGTGMNGGDWAAHTLEHAISAVNPKISHGAGLAVIFPALIEYRLHKSPLRFQRWATEVWAADNPYQAVHMFREKIKSWQHPISLRDLGVTEAQIPEILSLLSQHERIGGIWPLTMDDVEAIFLLAW